ncbi:LamG domain-containing protein [Tahibacter amnicola]|uniref:LamG domain-containing protein n=1 Tax=Tahibacter amnicola TaxID=2976241 RepID=A0ABY6BDB6_9GAMM|nr:LamG domain-containing protein [Tahibacter amnicola]UXI65907.1 LamG domain-containing protein [Tahibacter amnicola]
MDSEPAPSRIRRPACLAAAWFGLSCSFAQAQLVPVDWYRMGDNDDAPVGQTLATTADLIGTKPLTINGNSVQVTADVSDAAATKVGSGRSLQFTTRDSDYASGPLLTTATDNFGLEAWVKPLSGIPGDQVIAYNGYFGLNGFGIVLKPDNKYYGQIGAATFGGSSATLGSWTHLALVRSDGLARLYVNGVAVGFVETTPPATPTLGFSIGSGLPAGASGLQGLVDEVRYFTFPPGNFVASQLLTGAKMVPTIADDGSDSLRVALATATPGQTIVISATGTIRLDSPLMIWQGVNLAGPGAQHLSISGSNTQRVIWVDELSAVPVPLHIAAVSITNGLAKGGAGGFGKSGGGGGMGAGAGLFVNRGDVTLNHVSFSGNVAQGGNGGYGGAGAYCAGGGGGLGGDGGSASSYSSSAGGGGWLGAGGSSVVSAYPHYFGGAGGGGITGAGGTPGPRSGGGGGAYDAGGNGIDTYGGAGANSIGGDGGSSAGPNGTNYQQGKPGLEFGGGGGSAFQSGGDGGRYGGGGGGSGGLGRGGAGGDFGGSGGGNGMGAPGFGGGSGGNISTTPHSAIFGGGCGGSTGAGQVCTPAPFGGPNANRFGDGYGGGGGALGAAVFVRANNGASLTWNDSSTDAGSLTPGNSNDPARRGQTSGSGLFLLGGSTTLNVGAGTRTIAGSIGGWSGDPPMLTKTGTGTLVLSGGGSALGTVSATRGELRIIGSAVALAAGRSLTVLNPATLSGTAGVSGPVILANGGSISPGDPTVAAGIGTLALGGLGWSSTGVIVMQLGQDSGAASDHLTVNGDLTMAGTGIHRFTIADGTAARICGTTYTLINFTGNTNFTPADLGYTYSGALSPISPASFFSVGDNTIRFTVYCLDNQAITNFAATPANPPYASGGTFSISATPGASSSPLVFGSDTPPVCSVSGTTVTMHSRGVCTLTANQAADTTYNPAPTESLTLHFEQFTVNASAEDAFGTINPPTQSVDYDGTATFTVVPQAGHAAMVSGDTCTVTQGSGDTWMASHITANCNVTANFTDRIFASGFQ